LICNFNLIIPLMKERKFMAKFSLKKKLLPSLMAAGLASGVAFSGNASAIEVAADHTGQVLLGPFYMVKALGSEQGPVHIKVINRSKTHAVKARIAFRSQIYSTEVLDFILYLSPRDVWRGMVVNVDGQAYVKSTDDSVRNLPNSNSFASIEGTPANVMMFDHKLAADDNNEMGHFEIIGVYSVTGNVQTPSGNVLIKQGMSKYDLAKIFDTPLGNQNTNNSLIALNQPLCANGATSNNDNTECMIRTDDPANLQLRGEVSFDVLGERFSYVMTALDANKDGTGKVISNPFYDVAATQSVDLGVDFSLLAPKDNILEIEKALAAEHYGASYEYLKKGGDGTSIVFVTFPTKYKHNNFQNPCGVTNPQKWTPPFDPTGSMIYNINQYDNQENGVTGAEISVSGGPVTGTAITPEVEWFLPEWAFGSGWYYLKVIAATGCEQHYNGAPAIVNTMTLRSGQSEFLPNSSW
jgi:hypothetical protein